MIKFLNTVKNSRVMQLLDLISVVIFKVILDGLFLDTCPSIDVIARIQVKTPQNVQIDVSMYNQRPDKSQRYLYQYLYRGNHFTHLPSFHPRQFPLSQNTPWGRSTREPSRSIVADQRHADSFPLPHFQELQHKI